MSNWTKTQAGISFIKVDRGRRNLKEEQRRRLIRMTKAETRRKLILAGINPITAKKLTDVATADEIREFLAKEKAERTSEKV